jgi:hypothetical protein
MRNIKGNVISSIAEELKTTGFLVDDFAKLQAAVETATKALGDKTATEDTAVLTSLKSAVDEFYQSYRMLVERCEETFDGQVQAVAGIGMSFLRCPVLHIVEKVHQYLRSAPC